MGNVKPLHNRKEIHGMTYLRYQFLNRKNNPMDLQKIENMKVEIIYKGEIHNITNDCQKIYASRTLSIFVSPMTIKEIFGKRNIVCRIRISWNYRNNKEVHTYIENLKFLEDNFTLDARKRDGKNFPKKAERGDVKEEKGKKVATKKKVPKLELSDMEDISPWDDNWELVLEMLKNTFLPYDLDNEPKIYNCDNQDLDKFYK